MFKNAVVIARNTFRETIRDRILYGIVGFALIYILLDLFLAKVALGDVVMIKSFGLAGIYIFGLVATIFLGASIIYKEIERRTLYFVLAKPVARRDVIVGKFLGLFAAVLLTTLLMTIVYLLVIAYEGGGFDRLALLAVTFQLLEMALFIALLIFFSSIAAPLTATICALVLLFSGHMLGTVLNNAQLVGGLIHKAVLGAYYLLPNLEKFNLRNLVVHDLAPTWEAGLLTVAYAAVYIAVLLWAATALLKKREL